MELKKKEFDAMQMGWRKWWIKHLELHTFRKFGLTIAGADILEVGCGSGYAASLVCADHPASYTGLDIMPEQLALARNLHLPQARFIQGSADDLHDFPDESLDAVLEFCILHHVVGWRTFFDECHRVLRPGGCVYAADLSRRCIHWCERTLGWEHDEVALFTFDEFEREANARGFITAHKAIDLGLEGYFCFQKV